MLIKNTVQKAFDEIIVERVQKVAWNKAQNNAEYSKFARDREIAFRLLTESLTTDRQRHLLDNLECNWNIVEGLMQAVAYRQGLEDSQMIHQELSELGISVTKESIE